MVETNAEIGALCDRLNGYFARAESQFKAANYGSRAEVPLGLPAEKFVLGFGKIADEWRLYVAPEAEDATAEPLVNASLRLRLAAPSRLRDLEAALERARDERCKELKAAIREVEAFFDRVEPPVAK